jgi:hypothetical protein
MFGRLFKPAFEIGAARLRAGPILVFVLVRRVDHAGDVAGTGQNEAHRPAEIFAAEQHRLRRRNVILAGGEIVDRYLDGLEVDRRVADRDPALGEPVIEIAVAKL